MPPIPQIGETTPIFASKTTVNESPNLFQSALKDSGITNTPSTSNNPFAKPSETTATPFGKPPEFTSFMKPGESSNIFPKPSGPSKSGDVSNIFPKPSGPAIQKPDLLTQEPPKLFKPSARFQKSDSESNPFSKPSTQNPFKNPFEKDAAKIQNPFEVAKEAPERNPFQIKEPTNKPVIQRFKFDAAKPSEESKPNPFKVSK